MIVQDGSSKGAVETPIVDRRLRDNGVIIRVVNTSSIQIKDFGRTKLFGVIKNVVDRAVKIRTNPIRARADNYVCARRIAPTTSTSDGIV